MLQKVVQAVGGGGGTPISFLDRFDSQETTKRKYTMASPISKITIEATLNQEVYNQRTINVYYNGTQVKTLNTYTDRTFSIDDIQANDVIELEHGTLTGNIVNFTVTFES